MQNYNFGASADATSYERVKGGLKFHRHRGGASYWRIPRKSSALPGRSLTPRVIILANDTVGEALSANGAKEKARSEGK